MLQITLKEYLAKLERLERNRPIRLQRDVPTMTDIARESGVSFVTVNRIANGHAKQLSLATGSKIIEAVRAWGFNMEACDLIKFTPRREIDRFAV